MLVGRSVAVAVVASFAAALHAGVSTASTVEVTLPPVAPVADAYVDASATKKSFGRATTLSAGSLPVRTSYLMFDVSGAAGPIRSATLSLQANSASTVGLDVRSVASTSWSERSIRYSNAPPAGAVAASSGAFAQGRISIDVTPLVTGDGLLSMALTSVSSTSILMSSRETGAGAPLLQVSYDSVTTPPVTLTSPATGTSTNDTTPTFAGAAGDAAGDSSTVTVSVFRGPDVSGSLEQTRLATRTGTSWAIDAQPALADGTYTARAAQADTTGDSGESAPSTFTVDTVAPQPTLAEPAPGSTVAGSRPAFSGTAGSDGGDASTVTVDVYAGTTASGTPRQTLQATRSGGSWSVTASSALENGTYTARATQNDAAGNTGTSAGSTFVVDAPATTTDYRDTVLADSPRGYWRLGETIGTIAADAAGTSAGTYLSGVTLAQPGAITGDLDTSARLDGFNDAVRIPNSSALNSASAFSLEAFVRPGALPGTTATIMRKDQQYLLRLTSQGNLIFRVWKSGEHELSTASGVVATDGWSHIVATYDGAAMRIYVNGRLRATMSLSAPAATSTSDLYLGASINYDWLAGYLDDVAVYTRALSAGDVERHYAAAGIIDTSPSSVRLETPESGATWDARVTFAGSAGTDSGDDPAVSVKVYAGAAVSGSPVRTLSAPVRVAGTFSVLDPAPLASGTYTAVAEQRDSAGNVGASQPSTFTVQASAAPHLLAAGDVAACDTFGDEATAELLDRLPGSVAPLGDLVYEYASSADYDNCYDPTWGRQLARSRPVPGSHDYAEGQTNGEPYFGYFGALAGDPTRGYYSYDVGSWHVIALNSMCSKVGGCGAGSPQEQWLRADLAANPSACTLAYWHDARFSSGSIHGSNSSMQPFWQALYDHGAEIVVSGHEHVYERFAPQTPGGSADAARGVRQFTVGTGGRSHYGFRSRVLSTSEVRNADTFGILDLTLRPGAYDWRFVPEAGKTFTDTGSTACH